MSLKERRAFGPDVVRASAAVLVLAVHFFMNTGFYGQPLVRKGMLLSAAARMACMTCVPLFLLLSGYLCGSRRWSRGYLRGLLPVVSVYLVSAVVCLAFRMLWGGEEISPPGFVRRVLDFSAVPYAWYVEMYLGLYLLMPFVNAAWNGLEEEGRRALTAVLIALTALPALTNLAGQLLPDWWTGLYPLTYYVVGLRLRERPIRARGAALLAGWLGLGALTALLRWVMAHGGCFVWAAVSDWGSVLVLGETVCLFSLLLRCTGEGWPSPLRWLVRRAAKLSLPIYLMSYLTDQLIYPPLTAAGLTPGKRLLLLPVMTAVSLAVSGVMAQCVDTAAAALRGLLPTAKEE